MITLINIKCDINLTYSASTYKIALIKCNDHFCSADAGLDRILHLISVPKTNPPAIPSELKAADQQQHDVDVESGDSKRREAVGGETESESPKCA